MDWFFRYINALTLTLLGVALGLFVVHKCEHHYALPAPAAVSEENDA